MNLFLSHHYVHMKLSVPTYCATGCLFHTNYHVEMPNWVKFTWLVINLLYMTNDLSTNITTVLSRQRVVLVRIWLTAQLYDIYRLRDNSLEFSICSLNDSISCTCMLDEFNEILLISISKTSPFWYTVNLILEFLRSFDCFDEK